MTTCLQGYPLLLCSLLLLAVRKGGFHLFLRLNLVLFGLCLHFFLVVGNQLTNLPILCSPVLHRQLHNILASKT